MESQCDASISSVNSDNSACYAEDDSVLTDSLISGDNGIITKEMEEEERRMAEEAAREEEEMKKQYEEQMKKEEKEQRYKRLMHLLNKSQFYSSFLLKKLEINKSDADSKTARKLKKTKPQSDSKENSKTLVEKNSNISVAPTDNATGTKDDNNDDVQKENSIKSPTTPSSRTSSRKRKANALYYNDSYNIQDVISKEDIENMKRAHIVDASDNLNHVVNKGSDLNDGSVKKTKITGLGLEVPIDQPDLLEGGILRDYQMEGVSWLKLLFESGMNGILADEMGLGKTIQLIAHICYLIERNVKGPFLIVAPLSTLSNWVLEFERFAPQVPIVLFHGSQLERMNLYSSLRKVHRVGEHATMPVVITSYEIPLKERNILQTLEWQYVIVDEGHRIKNCNTLLSRALRKLSSKNRLLLTGTPLQNNLTELWSLLNFLLPELFDDLSTFEAWFDLEEMDKAEGAEKIIQQEQEQKIISILHEILFPFLLRRLKSEILLDFPPKKEVMVYCPLTPLQIEMYEVIVDKKLANLLGDIEDIPLKRRSSSRYRNTSLNGSYLSPRVSKEEMNPSSPEYFPLDKMPVCRQLTQKLGATVSDGRPGFVNRIRMQNSMVVLKHIVNHPYLVRMPVRYDNLGNKFLHSTEDLKVVSGKLLVLDAMLAKLKERGHKVLIFCTSAMMLDILEEYLIMSDYEYRRLDGSSKLLDRKNDIYEFNTDPNIFVFLLTTRAGGLGINLTGADTVILYNSDWNPQADLQAQDRAHRIGQTKPVVVYRLNVAGTVDEEVINRASSKRKLEKIVMKNGAFNLATRRNKSEIIDLQELRELLKTTDTCKTMHSNGYIFSDEELEELLDRSDLISKNKGDENHEEKSEKALVSDKFSSPKKNNRQEATKKKVYEVLKVDE